MCRWNSSSPRPVASNDTWNQRAGTAWGLIRGSVGSHSLCSWEPLAELWPEVRPMGSGCHCLGTCPPLTHALDSCKYCQGVLNTAAGIPLESCQTMPAFSAQSPAEVPLLEPSPGPGSGCEPAPEALCPSDFPSIPSSPSSLPVWPQGPVLSLQNIKHPPRPGPLHLFSLLRPSFPGILIV
ncbi:unnamed protein product [Rangifer tarandus platyrhynchus]|uniref:Uncharacterized protein n=1 Tax=Rangifer tarandus platyrhynchus TaxID=3082113 RepID=A0AC59ZXT9_RANTA